MREYIALSYSIKQGKYMTNKVLTLLFLSVFSNIAIAQVVFDLGAQQFSNSVAKSFEDSTYDLGTSLASTSLAYNDGHYESKVNETGSLKVQIKDPQVNWGVSFSMYCYLGSESCGINLLDLNGQAININFNQQVISVDGTTLSLDNFKYGESINGTIDASGADDIIVSINGHNFTVTKPNFKLVHLEINLNAEGVNFQANITGLAITSSAN